MNRFSELEKKVDAAMESLSGIEKLGPEPFFYTRVQGRLMNRKKNVWEAMTSTVTRPAFAFLGVTMIVLINSFVALSINDSQEKLTNSEIIIADEYRSANSFYDLENSMP